MRPLLLFSVLLNIAIAAAIFSSFPRQAAHPVMSPKPDAFPSLINTCLITTDVNRLADFYAQVLQQEPRKEGKDYVEFRTGVGVLALFSIEAQENYIPGSTVPGQNRSAILEFKVADVDWEYARLQKLVKIWVKGPANQTWGTRSIYFRDPDGNLVDFFAPVISR